MGDAGHVSDTVSPASFGVSKAMNSVGGMRKSGDCAKIIRGEKNTIRIIPAIKKNFLTTDIVIRLKNIGNHSDGNESHCTC
ncbi:hypothetical protein BROSI_A1850 [Candidatus Brocadia sinica JPN1]|uniref:Uncharacterized protein n=1 Tax=Candidatus Brocadia sinica JPN1 TaxID=1197129 RepID=A0ABQ0JX90_9BACT|nr:hypothetical protein BROSI_A1850 [Candidatus Brocadia sinica JPN1]GIK13170.1 MAG: hypothetical protein BroJett002_18770 [Candidatus Brocadia sinica]GJQ17021.1 MAG: hypothetical protein HBSIN01_09800 [Candidatus Brocadia sinica]